MNDDSPYTHVLLHDDLATCVVGRRDDECSVVERGLGKYWEYKTGGAFRQPMVSFIGDSDWRDYRFRAVVTPLSFEDAGPLGGFCGIVARRRNNDDYIALVIDRNFQVKLLRRTAAGFELLASAPLEFCLGQSLTLMLTVDGTKVTGSARPYTGETKLEATLTDSGGGEAGFICSGHARFGPHTVESTPEEGARVGDHMKKQIFKHLRDPAMKIERSVPLHGLLSGDNFILADLNGDGRPEVLVAQSSKKIAASLSLTRLTCLTALDLDGKILWQAGVPDPEAGGEKEIETAFAGALPFRLHDLFGDGHPVVVCVFGYDLQIRDARTGNVLMSAGTPPTIPVSDEFKHLTSDFGADWGDETLNMTVASIDFCDTQGNGGKREILIKDDYHNLAVLDTLSEPILYSLFRHRGNLGGRPWIGDIDGDGKDEILCGYSLLDDDGKLIASLALGGRARSVTVLKGADETIAPRVAICAGEEGLIVLDLAALRAGKYSKEIPLSARVPGVYPEVLQVAKFRADIPGEQYLAVQRLKMQEAGSERVAVQFTLFNEEFQWLWTVDLANPDCGLGLPVKWYREGCDLFLYSGGAGGLFDGHDRQIEMTPHLYEFVAVAKKYCSDGRDGIVAHYENLLEICVPGDLESARTP